MSTKPTFVIGDVHGCRFTLDDMIKELPNDADLIFVGDLVDKGNFSKEVVQFVIDNNYKSVIGNHEALMRRNIFKKKTSWTDSIHMGGYKTVRSYGDNIDIIMSHIDFIDGIPLYLEIDDYFITHGFGLPYYNRKNKPRSIRPIMSNRITHKDYIWDWEDWEDYKVTNIFGHSSFSEPKIGDNYYGIDTGCVYGNKLTAIELGTNEMTQVNVNPRDIQ